MDSIIHQWLSTLGDLLVQMKANAETERLELVQMIKQSEITLARIRHDFSHGNISLEERIDLIAQENPTRIQINERGVKYQALLDQIAGMEKELNDAFDKLHKQGGDTDEVFETVMRNIDARMAVE
jgi:hypothetical protein